MLKECQYYSFKLASKIMILMPYRLILLFGNVLGIIYYIIANRQRKRALRQIHERLGLSKSDAKKTIKKMFIKIAQNFCEILYLPKLTPENINNFVEFKNRHYLEVAIKEGKGVVYLTAHIGNWEWMGAALALNKFPITSIVKQQPNNQHNRILNEYRLKMGIEVFFSKSAELIKVARALKQGKLVGFLSDQDAGPNGIFIKFLGKMASTPQGAAFFAKKFNAPIIPAFISRRSKGGHYIKMYPPIYYNNTGNYEKDVYNVIIKINKIIEMVIKERPDEWIWFLKRWNTPFKEGSIFVE